MKVPSSPSVRLQTGSTAAYSAEGANVAAVSNPAAQIAQQFGAGLQDAGQAVLRVDDILRDREERARAKEADAKLADGYYDILSAPNANGRQGYRLEVGRAAIDKRQEAIQAIDAHRARILNTLTPGQRAKLADADAARYRQAREVLDGHYVQQLDAYELAETEARADSLMRDAVESALAPRVPDDGADYGRDPFVENRNALRTELAELAARRKIGPNSTALLMQKADDQLHGGIIERMLRGKRALDAADHLEKYRGEMSSGAVARVEADVRDAARVEQADEVVGWFTASGRPLTDQLAVLDAMHAQDPKGMPADLRADVEKRLFKADSDRRALRTTVGKELLENAQTWSQLNGGQALPETARTKLREAGVEADFDLWALQGNAFVTTNRGFLETLRMDDQELATRFANADQVIERFRADLSPDDLNKFVLRWRKARQEVLNPKDAETLDRSTAINTFLDRKEFFAAWGAGDEKRLALRRQHFEEAVVARTNELAKGGPVNAALRQQALTDVYANGFVVDGKWLPAVMATSDEAKRSESAPIGPSGRVVRPQEMTGAVDPTTARLVTGEVVDLRSPGDSDVVPTRGALIEALTRVNGGRLPSEPQISQAFADVREVQERRKADAQRIASIENRLRAQTLLTRLKDEVDREFAARADYSYRLRAWEHAATLSYGQRERIRSADDRLLDDPGVLAGKAPSGDFLRDAAMSPSERPREALSAAERARLVTESEDLVLKRHAETLSAYGISPDAARANINPRFAPGQPAYPAASAEMRLPGSLVPVPPAILLGPTPQEIELLKELRARYAKTEPKAAPK